MDIIPRKKPPRWRLVIAMVISAAVGAAIGAGLTQLGVPSPAAQVAGTAAGAVVRDAIDGD